MVHMVPLEFWHWAIPQVKQHYPRIVFIAEIYEVGLYRPFIEYGGFDYLYDKVNLYDTLRAIETQNHSAARLTGCWQTVEGIGDKMLNFLEIMTNSALLLHFMPVMPRVSCLRWW